ncbi:MAG: family 10 glycosylhydrolase [Bacteroidota bacterium]
MANQTSNKYIDKEKKESIKENSMGRRKLLKDLLSFPFAVGFAWMAPLEVQGENFKERSLVNNPRRADVVSGSTPMDAKFRNLYNADFGALFWNSEQWHKEGTPYTARSIHRFVDILADNGVDTLVVNPNSQVSWWYQSEVIPNVLDRYVRDDPSVGAHVKWKDNPKSQWFSRYLLNPALDLKEAGIDPLAETIKQCRRRGMSVWISIRMNDQHTQHPYLRCPLMDKEEYRYQGGLDHRFPEVRDYYFNFIQEVVERYDIDALELDWMRTLPGTTKEDTAVMTTWLNDIRKVVDAKARETGRYIYYGMRFPANYSRLMLKGLDVKTLASSGVLDFVCPSNFMATAWAMPIDQIKQDLGEDVALFGYTELWFNELCRWSDKHQQNFYLFNNVSGPALRANAAGKLVLGAAGIIQYNFFCGDLERKMRFPVPSSKYSELKGLGNLETLRGHSKHYSIGSNIRRYNDEFDLERPLPTILEPHQNHTFRIPMCKEPDDRGLKLILQTVTGTDGADPVKEINVRLNGYASSSSSVATDSVLFPEVYEPFNRYPPKSQRLNWTSPIEEIKACNTGFAVSVVREGWNEISVTNVSDQPVRLMSLEIGIL